MSKSVKISLAILFLTLVSLGGFSAYKVVSYAVDNTDYLAKGDTYLAQNQFSNALSSYEKYEIKNLNSVSIYQKIAKIYEQKSRFKDAIDVLKKGLNKIPDNSDLNYQLAEDGVLLINNDSSYLSMSADAYLNAAHDNKYKNIATYKAARLISQRGDDDSLNRVKNYYNSLPNYQPAQYELSLFNINNPDQSLLALSNAQKIPSSPNQGQLLLDFPNWDAFKQELTNQLNSVKDDILNNKSLSTIDDSKGYTAYKMNRCEFSIGFFKMAIAESEKEVFYPQARLLIGECLKRLKLYADAKGYLEPVLQQNPASIDARLILRQVYKGLSDTSNMKKMYDELITLDGQNAQTRLDYAQDLEFISDFSNSASNYAWLGQNLNDQSVLGNDKNLDYSLNKKYLIRAYEIYLYKVKDLSKASDIIKNAQNKNSKLIDAKTADELITWVNYQQNVSNIDLRNQAYSKSQSLSNVDSLYHTALIAKDLSNNKLAKDDALQAYDKDDVGYIAPLAAELVNEIDK